MQIESFQWYAFLIVGYVSLFSLVFALLILINPSIFHIIKYCKNINRKTSLYFFILAVILFFLANLLIPADFP